jgi:general stress protein YciG
MEKATKEYLSNIGRKGGKSKSDAKVTAARQNIAKALKVRLAKYRKG